MSLNLDCNIHECNLCSAFCPAEGFKFVLQSISMLPESDPERVWLAGGSCSLHQLQLQLQVSRLHLIVLINGVMASHTVYSM